MAAEQLVKMVFPFEDQDRKVRVYVPAHEEGEKLPVIYMTDGQNLFEDDFPGQFGCWYTREAVAEIQKASGKAAIIVGIHNDQGPIQRGNELTPVSIGEVTAPPEIKRQIDPHAERFDDFIIHTVKPEIERQFPVRTGRKNTAFCGSSSGGMFCFFTALSHPDIFSFAGVFSPCFMLYTPTDLDAWIRTKLCDELPFLYLYSGGKDELEQVILQSTEGTCAMLREYYPDELMKKVILPEKGHHESAWAPVFKDFLHLFLLQT